MVTATATATKTATATVTHRRPLAPTSAESGSRLSVLPSTTSTKSRTIKSKPPMLTPSSSLGLPSSSPQTPSSSQDEIHSGSKQQHKMVVPFTSLPAKHIYLQMNASMEEFPAVNGPATGEFIANGPIITSAPVKPLAVTANPSPPATRKRKASMKEKEYSTRKRRITNTRSSSITTPSVVWDSDATDTDTEMDTIMTKRMIPLVEIPSTPSPARTKMPLSRQNSLLNTINLAHEMTSSSSLSSPIHSHTHLSNDIQQQQQQQQGKQCSPNKLTTTPTTNKKTPSTKTTFTPIVSVPSRGRPPKFNGTPVKPYVSVNVSSNQSIGEVTRVRAVLVTGASNFNMNERSLDMTKGKTTDTNQHKSGQRSMIKSRSLPSLPPPPLLPKLHYARNVPVIVPPAVSPAMKLTAKKNLPRIIPSIGHTPNIILCRYCRKSCKGTHGCTLHWKHCEVKALSVDIKQAKLKHDDFRCPCMIRKTDKGAYHLKRRMSSQKTEAIRCPQCQLYAHVDCIWALGRAYLSNYTCPLCEISLTEEQIANLHDTSRPTKKRVKEYEKHLKQLHDIVNNTNDCDSKYCLPLTGSMTLPSPLPPLSSSVTTPYSGSTTNSLSSSSNKKSTKQRGSKLPSNTTMTASSMRCLSTVNEEEEEEEQMKEQSYYEAMDDYGLVTIDTDASSSDWISEDEAAIFDEGYDYDDDEDSDNEDSTAYLPYYHPTQLAQLVSNSVNSIGDPHTLAPLALHFNPLDTTMTSDISDDWSDPLSQVELLRWLDEGETSLTTTTTTSSTCMMMSNPWIDPPSLSSPSSSSSLPLVNDEIDDLNMTLDENKENMTMLVNDTPLLLPVDTVKSVHEDIWALDLGEQISEMFNSK
ncbi:hypothetical protein BDF19DRAFT_418958 [Syncephalis fuscata]|nr:hypothetical protein BDF19DRAFT_418958 [Syncephalis fuscata]